MLDKVLDLIASLDLIDRLDQWFGIWWHRRWSKRWRESGPVGVLDDAIGTASGQNTWRFYILRDAGWSGWQVERYLSRYGVAIWGRGFDNEHLYFSVKIEQANWAEYVILRKGIPLVGHPFNQINKAYPQRHPPGSVPAPGGKPKRNWLADMFGMDDE